MEFHKEYPIKNLKEWEKNPRKNDAAAEKLTEIIGEYGFINPIVIDQKGVIRAGHTRLKAAKNIGKETVPVLIYNFKDEAQAIGYALADNKMQERSSWDYEKLSEVLSELDLTDFDLDKTAFEEEELEGIMKEMDIDAFFETEHEEKETKPKKVVCPNCGEEIEI